MDDLGLALGAPPMPGNGSNLFACNTGLLLEAPVMALLTRIEEGAEIVSRCGCGCIAEAFASGGTGDASRLLPARAVVTDVADDAAEAVDAADDEILMTAPSSSG
jgi:hypothetical protein